MVRTSLHDVQTVLISFVYNSIPISSHSTLFLFFSIIFAAVSNHHHPKPRELIYAQGCDVARRTDSSYWKIWGESCTSYAPCHMCEGKCRDHDQCEGSLQCFYRENDADDSFISGCGSSFNGLEPGKNVCYYPGEGLPLTTDGEDENVTTASLYECEGDCGEYEDSGVPVLLLSFGIMSLIQLYVYNGFLISYLFFCRRRLGLCRGAHVLLSQCLRVSTGMRWARRTRRGLLLSPNAIRIRWG